MAGVGDEIVDAAVVAGDHVLVGKIDVIGALIHRRDHVRAFHHIHIHLDPRILLHEFLET